MRTWDPNAWDKDPNKWGTAGLIWNGTVDPRTLTNGSGGEGWTFDPRYQRRVQDYSSEGGGQSSFEFTDHYNKLFDNGNQVQIRDINRLIDRNAAKWGGDEVGWLTHKDNYKSDDDWLDKNFFALASAPLLGMTAMHALGIPQGSISEAWNHVTGSTPGSTGAPYGTDAVEAAEWFGGPGAATNPSPGLFGSSATGGLLGGGLEGLLQGAMKNPLQALGLLQTGLGLIQGNQGSNSSNGSSNGPGNPWNLPKGNRGAWTPNPITAQQIANFTYAGRR